MARELRDRNVKVAPNGLEIGGALHPLYSGDVHYWRLRPELWERILDRVVEMGFRFVCTYIPWSVHEVERGRFDFGEKDPAKNLDRFMELCRERGLFLLARPGPHINAELTYFGYPPRLFEIDELLSRNPDGAPAIITAPPRFFPAISYASEAFYEETALYFDALCPILKKHIHPAGSIVGVQSDNEMSFFFRVQPYDQDYSASSIVLYHKYLAQKYGAIEELNDVYRRRYSDFGGIMPPREFAPDSALDMPCYLDWMEYKEHYILYGLHRVAQLMRDRGVADVFWFHNFPMPYPVTPFNVPLVEQAVDVQGVDLYCSRAEYAEVKKSCSFLASSSRMAFSPEFGSGIWTHWQPRFLEDQRMATPAAFMHGLKAINFYMIVERERWYGSPVTRTGETRQDYFDYYKKLLGFLHETNFHEYKAVSEAALLSVQDYERAQAAASLVTPLPNQLFGVPEDWLCDQRPIRGLRDSIPAAYQRQRRAWVFGFSQAGVPLDLADSGVDIATLERFKLLIVPSFDFMSMALQRKLLVYVLKGGTLAIGPRAPMRDNLMRSSSKFETHLLKPKRTEPTANHQGILLEQADVFDAPPFLDSNVGTIAYTRQLEKGGIVHFGFLFPEYHGVEQSPVLASIAKKLAAVAGLQRLYPPDDPLIETRLHTRGEEKILFAANPTASERTPVITSPHGETFVDAIDGDEFAGAGAIPVRMPPRSVRILKITRKQGR